MVAGAGWLQVGRGPVPGYRLWHHSYEVFPYTPTDVIYQTYNGWILALNSNHRCVYLVKQLGSLLHKEIKHWHFRVVFAFDVVNPYCITSLTVWY